MPDADLPAVSSHAPGASPALPGRPATGGGGLPVDGRPSRAHRILRGAGLPAAVLVGLVATLGLASLVGDAVRSAVLVEVETEAPTSLSVRDAPEEATRFFARRDTVTVTVPRDMTVAELLALYHLETSTAAREALRDQLGAGGEADRLREGDRVTFPLTLARPRSP